MEFIDGKIFSDTHFIPGKCFDLGVTSLTEKEIIDFAKTFDPLDFHTNRDAAAKSPFKSIIASGPHIFTIIHRDRWIPVFGKTVIAGLEIREWKFLKPVYPDQKIHGYATITSIKPNPDKKHAVINWLYEFKNDKQELVQILTIVVLHKIS